MVIHRAGVALVFQSVKDMRRIAECGPSVTRLARVNRSTLGSARNAASSCHRRFALSSINGRRAGKVNGTVQSSLSGKYLLARCKLAYSPI